ncbi:hypothetical protein F5Y06DRAFT_274744 [Hypoxylon sp. FL0890]|nr:hypothetical protein F5Y06DRAFT_274744 [Hypoxylon sp. FL0890]
MLIIRAPVQHTNISVWGDDAGNFQHMRSRLRRRSILLPRAPFCQCRDYGASGVLGAPVRMSRRSQASGLSLTWDNSPPRAGSPPPDRDINVEL